MAASPSSIICSARRSKRCSTRPTVIGKSCGCRYPLAAPVVFDQRTDVMQIGAVTLALLLGRPIEPQEWPEGMAALAKQACEATAVGSEAFRTELHMWLRRMLHLPDEEAFTSAGEAWSDLERVLASSEHTASFGALAFFMTEYARSAAHDSHGAVNVAAGPKPLAAPAVATTPLPVPSVATTPLPAVTATASPAPGVETKAVATDIHTRLAAASPTFAATPPPALVSTPAAPAPWLETRSDSEERIRRTRYAPPEADIDGIAELRDPSGSGGTVPRAPACGIGDGRQAVLVALAASAALIGRPSSSLTPSVGAEALGTLVVNTDPAGAPVIIDGTARGVTPLTLGLPQGAHELLIVGTDGEPRVIPLNIVAGSTVAQTIELSNKAAARTGELMVRSDPPGARVTLDGASIGTAPITLDGHHARQAQRDADVGGRHRIAGCRDRGGQEHRLFSCRSHRRHGVPVSGWISVSAPVEVQVYENARLLGTSRSDRIMVSAGRHELEIVNEALSFRAAHAVTVSPGKVAAISPQWPKAPLALNAQPWAEVWIDGESVGETPIGKVLVPIGWHEIVFRHPQLGEQVVRATVTGAAPARVSVDMSKRQ